MVTVKHPQPPPGLSQIAASGSRSWHSRTKRGLATLCAELNCQ